MALFQPAEELGGGAERMLADGLFERFGRPDVSLGQHVFPMPAGVIGAHSGPAFSASDVLKVTVHGRGAHGSRPEDAIDPVVIAAAIVMRLQTVVAREISGSDTAVVTVGTLHAGTKANIIPAEATLTVNIRSYTPAVRERLLAAVRRIIRAEAEASGAIQEPTVTVGDVFPVLLNDPPTTERVMTIFGDTFDPASVLDPGAVMGSEDFGYLGTGSGIPSSYWLIGGIDPALYAAAIAGGPGAPQVPTNHSPFFAPVMEPTISIGVKALVAATLGWLARTVVLHGGPHARTVRTRLARSPRPSDSAPPASHSTEPTWRMRCWTPIWSSVARSSIPPRATASAIPSGSSGSGCERLVPATRSSC